MKKNILIVEDEIIIAINIQYILQSMGYNVCGITDTGECATKEAELSHPDLILMDINLKGELNGIQTAQQIRSIHDIPIVYLTAYSDENTYRQAIITNKFGYLIKPFDEFELFYKIEIALYRHNAEKKLYKNEEKYQIFNNQIKIPEYYD